MVMPTSSDSDAKARRARGLRSDRYLAYLGIRPPPVVLDTPEGAVERDDEVEKQGKDHEQDSDCLEDPDGDNRCPDLWLLFRGCLEVLRRRLFYGRPKVMAISHKRQPFSQGATGP